MNSMQQYLNPLNLDRLRTQFQTADPFPFIAIDDFLKDDLARKIASEYPGMSGAREQGHAFSAVNERGKVQITDPDHFGPSTRALYEVLASSEWLSALEYVSGIPKLLADEELVGGGMHLMGSGGHLDVHIDFNLLPKRQLFRRLNILVFLNEQWEKEWGGRIELWDPQVRVRRQAFTPVLNRCVIFETSDRSYHGVERVQCPKDRARQSFAGYYYTSDPPAGWDGKRHSTVFKPRPDERIKGGILMPASRVANALARPFRKLSRLASKTFER